jgi:hypothetical protein
VPRLDLSFNMIQSRAVTGLLTGHNTLRTHLYLLRLSDSSLCRCEAEDETSAHILCECEALAPLRHLYLGSFFLQPEDINLLKTKCNVLYIGNQSVLHCKHFPIQL